MAEVILAKTAGFCFGVTKAVEKVYELAAESDGAIYTYGPIIHNDEVVKDLKSRGVKAVTMEEALLLGKGDTVVIRSHGITASEEEKLKKTGVRLIDATCPFVKKIHKIVSEASDPDETLIVVGDPDHPEVRGIKSRCGEKAFIIKDLEAINTLPKLKKVKIVSQTTFNYEKFQKIVDKMRSNCYYTSVMNTICNATQERQSEARSIASGVDAMIVIGDQNSSNTQKLYEIFRSECKNTCFVQTVADLKQIEFPEVQRVGITAGASTPGIIIQEVLIYVRTKL